MFEFEKLCKEVEKLDPATYNAIIAEKSLSVLYKLAEITEDELDGITIYTGLLLGSVIADNKIAEEEFALVEPMFNVALGKHISLEEANEMMKYFRKESRYYRQFVKAVVDLFGDIDDELKIDMITVCLLICAVDGKISIREKQRFNTNIS